MPEEAEVPVETLEDKIKEVKEEIAEGAEKAAKGEQVPWITYLAVTTALMAVLAAISSLLSGQAADEALLKANDAVYYEAIAVDAWAEFQADSIKAVQETTTAALLTQLKAPPDVVKAATDEAARRKNNQNGDQATAQQAEKQRDAAREESNGQAQRRGRFSFAVTLFQVAIGLSAVAALVRIRAIWYVSLVGALGGIILLAVGFAPVSGTATPAGTAAPPAAVAPMPPSLGAPEMARFGLGT